MPYQVLVDSVLPDEVVAMIGAECVLHLWPADAAALATLGPQIDAVFTYGHPRIDGALLDALPRVKVVSNFGVGVDHIDLAAARARGVPVGNTPNVLDGATADMTFALLMAIARKVVVGDRYARSAAFTHFDPNLMLGSEVYGQTLGIVGMGNIGRQVAARARGFAMPILYHNRRRDEAAEAALGARYCTLDELLRESDFVALNLPLTPESRNLIGAAQLALMKPTAYLINAARGGVLDHMALSEALQRGQIAGAALDVTEPEPLPRDHPLLTLDNLVIVPHLGSATLQTRRAMAQLAVDNLHAGLAGRALVRQVS